MILIISGVVVAAVNLSGASLRASARTELQSEVLDALDQIEQDVKLSVDFEGTSTDRISVHNLATSTNPLSADRKLIKNSTCTVAPTGLSASDALAYKMQYTVVGTTLKRVATLDKGCAASSVVWQKGIDERLITTDKSIDMAVTTHGSNAIEVKLTATRTVAGEDISYTGWLYVRSINF